MSPKKAQHRSRGGTYDGKTFSPPEVDYAAQAEQFLKYKLLEFEETSRDWRTELALGIIDDADKQKLTEWSLYAKALRQLDLSMAPDIEWPEAPSV